MGDWQPIETAPTEVGLQLWGWSDDRGSNPMIRCDDRWLITYDDTEIEPTHWMPLPEPPTVTDRLFDTGETNEREKRGEK